MLDQSQLQAIFEYALAMGNVDLFSPLFGKLYALMADDDWAPGEVRAANRFAAEVIKIKCPLSDKVKRIDDLDGCPSCPWSFYDLRRVLYG